MKASSGTFIHFFIFSARIADFGWKQQGIGVILMGEISGHNG